MARSTALQPKAGYIDARPFTANSSKSSCYARPDHTCGSIAPLSNIEQQCLLHPQEQTFATLLSTSEKCQSHLVAARASSVGGTTRLSAQAVCRSITSRTWSAASCTASGEQRIGRYEQSIGALLHQLFEDHLDVTRAALAARTSISLTLESRRAHAS
jgi:hypothetical protein